MTSGLVTYRDSCRYSARSGKTSLLLRKNEIFPSKSEVVPGGRIPENELLLVKTEVLPDREHPQKRALSGTW